VGALLPLQHVQVPDAVAALQRQQRTMEALAALGHPLGEYPRCGAVPAKRIHTSRLIQGNRSDDHLWRVVCC
jgi:hypothetical protein